MKRQRQQHPAFNQSHNNATNNLQQLISTHAWQLFPTRLLHLRCIIATYHDFPGTCRSHINAPVLMYLTRFLFDLFDSETCTQ